MQSFLENLHKKYGNNGKGDPFAMLRRLPLLNSMKKAMTRPLADGHEAGIGIAQAQSLGHVDLVATGHGERSPGQSAVPSPLVAAGMRSNPNDPNVNRQSAIALTRLREYDQAIACWHRVEKAGRTTKRRCGKYPNLALRKAREQGKLDESLGMEKPHAAARELARAEEEMSPENRLLRAIAATPTVVKHYYDLMQICSIRSGTKRRKDLAARALKILPDDIQCREHWEDAHLRHWRCQVARRRRRPRSRGPRRPCRSTSESAARGTWPKSRSTRPVASVIPAT